MNIETEHLQLRDYEMGDLENYFRLKACKEVWTYSTYIPLTELTK